MKETEYLDVIENFIESLAYSRHLDVETLYRIAAAMCTARFNHLAEINSVQSQ